MSRTLHVFQDYELQKRGIVEGTGSVEAVYLRCVGNAVQLGKAFSSNSSGDEPEEEMTGSCNVCLKATPVGRRACDTCNSKGVKSPRDQCAVCHVRVSGGSRRIYTESEAKEAKEA